MLLSRDQILSARLPHRTIEVAEWGGSVGVQQMSVQTRIDYLESVRVYANADLAWKLDQLKPENEREGLSEPAYVDHSIVAILKCLVDDQGKRLFGDDDYDVIRGLGYFTVSTLWEAVNEINQFDTVRTSEAVELEKKD